MPYTMWARSLDGKIGTLTAEVATPSAAKKSAEHLRKQRLVVTITDPDGKTVDESEQAWAEVVYEAVKATAVNGATAPTVSGATYTTARDTSPRRMGAKAWASTLAEFSAGVVQWFQADALAIFVRRSPARRRPEGDPWFG